MASARDMRSIGIRRISLRRRELARQLRAHRERRGETQDEVETRLRSILRQTVPRPDARRKNIVRLRPSSIETAEPDIVEQHSVSDLLALAEAYSTSPLMLDSLRSEVSDEICLCQERDQFMDTVLYERSTRKIPEAKKARYRIPTKKLLGAEDVHIVQLTLPRGGASDKHAHPGDEFVFVLKGEVEIHLGDSGLLTRLAKHDFLHFYAEQEHQIVNKGRGSAEVFIIRVFRFGASATRFKFMEELSAEVQKGHTATHAVREVRAELARFDMRVKSKEPSTVVDRFGLGRLLQLLCGKEFRGHRGNLAVRKVAKRGKKFDLARANVGRLLKGLAPVTLKDVANLAHAFDTQSVLLYDFFFPAIRSAVAVHVNEDLRPIPKHLISSSDVKYYVPCRRLADSDVEIAILELPPGAACTENTHPGYEMLLPLEGIVEIQFGEMRAEISASQRVVAHFASKFPHQVANPSRKGTAKTLIIRFYQ